MLAPVRALVAALSLLPASQLLGQSERPPEAFQLALGLQQRGLHEEAAQQFTDFLKAQPKHALVAEAHYRLGTSRAELGQVDAAVASLQQALQAAGVEFRLRPECRYRLGNLLEGKGQHREAVAQFGALGKEVGKDHYLLAPARFAEGEGWRELGDDAQAASGFAAAVEAAVGEQASFRFPALYQLGFALLRGKALADAAAVFAEAAKAAPDDAAKGECLYLQADTLLRQEQYDAAQRAFTAAQKVPSDFADDAAFGLGWVALGRGDQKAARRAFATFLERFGDSPLAGKARLELGRSLYKDQQHAEATAALAPLLEGEVAADVRQQARELTGLCALASGAGEQALMSLQKALAEAAPADRPRLSFALGEACANLGRWDEALAAYEAVPADAPPALRGDALYGACFALHSLGKHQDSNARAEALRALQPPHRLVAEAGFAIAENLFALQRYEPAEREYEALAQHAGLGPKATWKLAWCRYLRGERADAAVRFAALAKVEKSPFAEEALAMTALSQFEAGAADAALQTADRYRARYQQGAFLDRTERVASRVLRQKGDLGAAQKRLERAAAAGLAAGKAAESSGDQIEQAELAYQQGDFQAAQGLFAALAARPDGLGARALAGQAWCAFELGDDDGCAKFLAAGQAHPAVGEQAAGLLELQSALHHRRQDWAAAVATAQAFLQRFGKHGKAPALRYALGVAQARSGDAKAAAATLAALQRDGGYERMDRVAYELGWALRRSGDEAGALAAFAVVAKDSQDPELAGEANLHLGTAVLEAKDPAARDLGKARELLTRVAGSHRGRALYRLGFAELEAAGKDVAQLGVARDRFATIAGLPQEPLVAEALFLGAECCVRLGDPRGASERLQQLLQLDSKHERADRARLQLGECAVALGDGNVAVPVLEEFLRAANRDPADAARAHLALGRARQLRGEHDKAEASLRRTTELSDGPLAAEAQFRIGEVRAQRGDLQGAADAFVKLPILYAHAEWVRKGLLQAGLVYEQLQQPDKAQRFFQELCKQHAGSDEAKTAATHRRDG